MAYIIPSDISQLALSNSHKHELETLSQLKAKLSNDYTVFHGVHWTREYESNSMFGEIDFVIINQSGDILFIEQKNGGLDETPSGLVKRYDRTEKNVIEQIHRSIDNVRDKFSWQNGKKPGLNIDNLIYCPDYTVRNLNAPGVDKSRVVDSASKHELTERIEKVLGVGVSNESWRNKVFDFFCQTFEVVPSIHQHISSQEKTYVRQTGALASILSNLTMSPYRLRINGVAGSGKSHIARQFMVRSCNKGHKVMMLCYNRPLAEKLKKNVPGDSYVNTWQGFIAEFLQSKGDKLDFDLMRTSKKFWRETQEKAAAEDIPAEWMFDTLIIDEGQDFEDEWFEILKLFVSDDADILWLEDTEQNIYSKSKVKLDGFVGYRCPINYRTPESIARFIRNTLPFEFEFGNDLSGLGVGVHGYQKDIEQIKKVTAIIQDLTKNLGFSLGDIVVITCGGVNSSTFSNMDKIGGVRTRAFSGKYDSDGNQLLSKGDLVFDSVFRFKGKESPAVILVDVDPSSNKLNVWPGIIYCGMTRATVRLDIVINEGNPENSKFIKYIEQ